MAGLTFDSDFSADYWLSMGGNAGTWPRIQAYYGELPASGGGSGAYLGMADCGGPGTLSGGTNPYGFLVTVDEPQGAIFGGTVAAPIFQEIARFALQYLEVPPDNPSDLQSSAASTRASTTAATSSPAGG